MTTTHTPSKAHATLRMLTALLALCLTATMHAADYNIRDYGAVPKKKRLCTAALQKAIDECSARGGGRVIVPKGKWYTGAIVLKNGVDLHLQRDAFLYGSTNPKDYVLNPTATIIITSQLIYAINAHDIAISGEGTIDGRGAGFTDAACNRVMITRPMLIRFDRCKRVTVSGVTMRNAAVWMQHYYECENLTIKDINVWNYCNNCNDGIDITSCDNVTITGCTVDSDDDAICLKSTSLKPCQNVTVTNCTVGTHCNALKIGSETVGDCKNITFSHCKVVPAGSRKVINGHANAVAALAVESIDGAAISDITFSDITIQGSECPIFIRLGNRNDKYGQKINRQLTGSINGVTIRDVTVTGAGNIGSSITGIPGQMVENVSISNVTITHKGGMHRVNAPRDNREKSEPNAMMWGTLPAKGFFMKYARNVRMNNVKLISTTADERPEVYREHVE